MTHISSTRSPTRWSKLASSTSTLFAKVLYDLAHELGFDCLVAHTADEGVELATQFRLAAVVLDIKLPDHSGFTVLDRLKHNPLTRHVPVQVVSAEDNTRIARAMGAAGALIKPVNREALVQTLSALKEKFASESRTVLVVEDNELQRESIRQLLASDTTSVETVDNAAAALEKLRSTTFDCMVLDLSLPDASGHELLERMAADDAYAFPPVIVYTGRAISAEEEQQLRKYSRSIIIKGAKSPERLLDEVSLFLHQVEEKLPPDRQRMLRDARAATRLSKAGASSWSRTTCATSSRCPACWNRWVVRCSSRAMAARRSTGWPASRRPTSCSWTS